MRISIKTNKIALILIIFLSLNACSTINHTEFHKYKKYIYKKSLKQSYEESFIKEIFHEINFNEKNLIHDREQFIKQQNFNEYYKNAVNLLRKKKAIAKLNIHREILSEISKTYQVQPEYIISLWAIESNFGKINGNFNVINSIFNLAYEGRRRNFFENEFFSTIKLIKENNFKPHNFLGSWAGASGQCQFMPSTYLNFAVDYNLDGKRDIWHSKADIFASIANYLNKINWDYNLPYGYEIKYNKKLLPLSQKEKKYKLSKLVKKYQITPKNKKSFKENELNKNVGIISYDDRIFILFNNFYAIKEWNNSNYFALTIGIFAETIK